MNEIAVCAIAFGDQRYIWRMDRFKESLQATNPEVRLFSWVNTMPDGARPFHESMYGFKPHAINIARQVGHKKIFWIDSTTIIQDKLDYYDQCTAEHGGVLAVQDDNKLTGFCSDRALRYTGYTREDLKTMHLVGGSLYYFDFNYPTAERIFEDWLKSEKDNMFGSMMDQCSEQLQGHRQDETMMSLFLYKNGSKPFTGATRYNWEKGGIVLKQHFK